MPTLTDMTASRYNPKADRFEVPDSVVPGLRLIVQPSGMKSWASGPGSTASRSTHARALRLEDLRRYRSP